MKTFRQFLEQSLTQQDQRDINIAAMKAADSQRIKEKWRQKRHVEHEMELRSSRENKERMRRM